MGVGAGVSSGAGGGNAATSVAVETGTKPVTLVAQEMEEDEAWLNEIIDEMEPEDGLIWVYGPGGKSTAAFSNFGVENLEDIIRERRRPKK